MEPRVTESATDRSELVLYINTVMNHDAKGRFFLWTVQYDLAN